MSDHAESDMDRTYRTSSMELLDFDIIEDMPWAQELWTRVENHTKKGFLNWCKIVKKLVGTKAENILSRQYDQTMDDTCTEMVQQMGYLQNKTMDKIQELQTRLQKICIELHQNMPQKIGAAELSLFEEQAWLIKQINEYETIINNKKKELETVQETFGGKPKI